MQAASFSELNLLEPIQNAVRSRNYRIPTPIQARAIPYLLTGGDLLACAQTGTGKTAAFALPILQRLFNTGRPALPSFPRSLVLTPTRELAAQTAHSFRLYGRNLELVCTVIHGGVAQGPQITELSRGVDTLVATTGRLLGLMNQGYVKLDNVEIVVLDEADRMLDMGFITDVKAIAAALPKERQTLYFSATLPPAVQELADTLLTNPMRIDFTTDSPTIDTITQKVIFVERSAKRALLGELLKDSQVNRALVFTRTRHGANRIARHLARVGIKAGTIHGNKPQSAREYALNNFRSGRIRVLVATDIAARGIDVEGISHVINYDLPHEPEWYIHRIGRTARAGAVGTAITLCEEKERVYLRTIEKLMKQTVQVVKDYSTALNEPGPVMPATLQP